ncbi:VOC family protein [Sphingomonas azotifigens]|uniref:VOC family protein n=1 Tax=Sphingomonas azotifigens TaxID=330920 RepID=UPI000A042D5A|nr:VOC family protein [Sphingomonas azotifigens]
MRASGLLLALGAPLGAAPASAQTASVAPAQAEHVAIQASDIDRSATFYHEAFGLRLIPTPLKNRRWLDLGHGMALHILDGRTAPKPSNRDEHLALHVDDLATVTAWLDAHHLVWTNFTGEPRKMQLRFDGVRQIYVQDPDGYWLEVGDSRGVPAK